LIEQIKSSDKVAVIETVSQLTVGTAMKGTQLTKLKREHGKDAARIIYISLQGMNNVTNVKNKMNEDQMLECSYSILEKYKFMKLEEILLVFRMISDGEMGITYRLDRPTIFEFINKYDGEIKTEFLENRHFDQKSNQQKFDRQDNSDPKHISLSVDEIKKLGKK